MVGFTEEELEIIEGTNTDAKAISSLPKKHQEQVFHILADLNEAFNIIRENEDGLNASQIRIILSHLRQAKKSASKYEETTKKKDIKNEYTYLKDLAEEKIEQMQDLHKETIAYESQPKPKEDGFFDTILDGVSNTIKWSIIIGVVGLVIILLLAPTYIYPIMGKCVTNEKYGECLGRITAEKKLVEEFTQCQDSCGRGFGNEICLEQCEYEYRQGKYKPSNIYTTSTGYSFECPLGTKGFEDSQGKPYCGVD